MPIAYRLLPLAWPIADCLLPTAYWLLRIAYCLLHIAHGLLPADYYIAYIPVSGPRCDSILHTMLSRRVDGLQHVSGRRGSQGQGLFGHFVRARMSLRSHKGIGYR